MRRADRSLRCRMESRGELSFVVANLAWSTPGLISSRRSGGLRRMGQVPLPLTLWVVGRRRIGWCNPMSAVGQQDDMVSSLDAKSTRWSGGLQAVTLPETVWVSGDG